MVPSASACSNLRIPWGVTPTRAPNALELMPKASRTVFAHPHPGAPSRCSFANSQNCRSSSAKRVRSRQFFNGVAGRCGNTLVAYVVGVGNQRISIRRHRNVGRQSGRFFQLSSRAVVAMRLLGHILLIRHGLLQSPDAVQLEPVEGLRHLSPSKVYE